MHVWLKRITWGGTVLAALALGATPAVAQYGQEESFTDKVGSAFKKGFDTLASPFQSDPEIPSEPDPTRLSEPAKPSPESHVAMARLLEQQGKTQLAVDQYERALKLAPQHLGALVGYARMKDNLGNLDGAVELYLRAGKAHPKEAAVPNDLGLCYAKRGRYDLALAALGHAVQLEPGNARYRANIATVLVDMNRPAEALAHLQAVGPEAVAHYNLAYLLSKKGDREGAAQHYRAALEKDPTLSAAQQGLAQLGLAPAAGPAATTPPAVQAPAEQPSAPPMVAIQPLPRVEHRTAVRSQFAPDPLPAIMPPSVARPPIAPLPPVSTTNPRVRPLPPVRP